MFCKVCNSKIKPFLSFGKMPMANGFLAKKDFKREFFYKLEVGFCKKDYLFQVNDHPKSPNIFNNHYPFYTNKSKLMTKHFKNYFKWSKKFLNRKSKIIEIGSNDGTFLRNFKTSGYEHLGIEPSKNVANYSKKINKVKVKNEFFNEKNCIKLKKFKKKTDLICAANVISHIPNLNDLIRGLDFLISKKGVFVFEEPYLGSMFKRTSYDQIYDAHIFIFSIHSVEQIFLKFGFELIDAMPQKTHGGSMRYIISRFGERNKTRRLAKLMQIEKKSKLNKISSCLKFKKNCYLSKIRFKNKIIALKKSGKKIAGYAASAKSSTVLNFCNINYKHIDYIVDSTKEKIGKFSPGSHIPIVPVNFFRKNYPDYLILCSWNHTLEIKQKEKRYTRKGGKWISHVTK
jgi:methylation protein EvaC